jgi:hypothetical protein
LDGIALQSFAHDLFRAQADLKCEAPSIAVVAFRKARAETSFGFPAALLEPPPEGDLILHGQIQSCASRGDGLDRALAHVDKPDIGPIERSIISDAVDRHALAAGRLPRA